MKRTEIKAGFETFGKTWGDKIWLVKDLTRKRAGNKRYFCVMGHSKTGWWHLYYGTLLQCRDYIEYETGEREYKDIRDNEIHA